MTRTLPFLIALLVSFSACKPATKDTEATTYRVSGVLQMVKGEDLAIIDHEEIPGYMEKMIMPFKVKDPAELEGLKPGAVLEFDYVVSDLSSWMENVTDTGETGELKLGKPQSALPAE